MESLKVALPNREYEIIIKEGLLAELSDKISPIIPKAKTALIVSDSNVFPIYANIVKNQFTSAGLKVVTFMIPAGETSKCLNQLEILFNVLIVNHLTRTDVLVALGGGVVGDLVGLAAATYLRGIDFIQIPTTLIAQVDSSVGGKTAIDMPQGKNLIGAFWQPKAVFIDPLCLNTLPDRVFNDGMAEVIKYGCILDKDFFEFLESCKSRQQIMNNIEKVIYTCCKLKAGIVLKDETDNNQRMILNFGHTFAHAYELAGNYEKYSHGEAVAAGMCIAAEIGEQLQISPTNTYERIKGIVKQFHLPQQIKCTAQDYKNAISLDKKGSSESIKLILLSNFGESEIVKMERQSLLNLLNC